MKDKEELRKIIRGEFRERNKELDIDVEDEDERQRMDRMERVMKEIQQREAEDRNQYASSEQSEDV